MVYPTCVCHFISDVIVRHVTGLLQWNMCPPSQVLPHTCFVLFSHFIHALFIFIFS